MSLGSVRMSLQNSHSCIDSKFSHLLIGAYIPSMIWCMDYLRKCVCEKLFSHIIIIINWVVLLKRNGQVWCTKTPRMWWLRDSHAEASSLSLLSSLFHQALPGTTKTINLLSPPCCILALPQALRHAIFCLKLAQGCLGREIWGSG